MGLKVQGLGFKVPGSGFNVEGSGLTITFSELKSFSQVSLRANPFFQTIFDLHQNPSTQNPSYETLKANRRTAEYRITNFEGWFRLAQSF